MIYEVTSIEDPRIAPFCKLTEAQLRSRLNADQGIFIAESPKVIRVALQAGYEPEALLCEKKHIEGDAATIIQEHPDMPVYMPSATQLILELSSVLRQLLVSMLFY